VKLLLATDAWFPQINGVVRTLSMVVGKLREMGHEVEVIATGDFPAIPMPSYPEIKVSIWLKGLRKRIETFNPDAIHIATEGAIGIFTRNYCLKNGFTFTTSFHTRFPEYIRERAPIPLSWTYPPIRGFHRQAFRTLVPTQKLKDDLTSWGFEHLEVWGRGVDTDLFNPQREPTQTFEGPVYLNVGRVAPEKNITAFLDLDLPGTKVVVGDGPQLDELKQAYPDVVFPGAKQGEELAGYFAQADVFVFPSLTDTFGLVMLEANACGTPVAAFPVTGPLDVLKQDITGVMHQDLGIAIERASRLERQTCREEAMKLSWDAIATQFLHALMPLNSDKEIALRKSQWLNPVTQGSPA